jgi:hypothetical protein
MSQVSVVIGDGVDVGSLFGGAAVVARAADHRPQQDEQECERKAGEADSDALGSGSGVIDHVSDETMVRTDDMQAAPLTEAGPDVQAPES